MKVLVSVRGKVVELQDKLFEILRDSEVGTTNWLLANAVLRHGNQLSAIPIQELAESCHVSEPTVSRFSKLLGFRSYIDLKKEAKKLGDQSDLHLFHMNKPSLALLKDRPQQFLESYCQQISENLLHAASSLDFNKIDAFLAELHQTKRVFIFGTSTSLMLAEILQSNLANYKKIVYAGFNQDQQLNHAQNLTKSDLAITISTYGNFLHQYPATAKMIADSECRNILITQNAGLQETYMFDDVIFLSNKNSTETGTYSMLLGIEYLVRRYAVLFKV